MSSFASSIKSPSPCKGNGINVLEFPGGIAYDHDTLPKIVAVHTLIEVNPEQINAQIGTSKDTDVKKEEFRKIPVAQERRSRHGSRRWIILSKPELPFSQITTAPKTPEDRYLQRQPLPNPSLHESLPKFDFCDINRGYCCKNLDFKSQNTTKSGEICKNKSPISPNQELVTCCTDHGNSSTDPMISRQLSRTEIKKDTSKASNAMIPEVNLTTPCLDADEKCIPSSMKFSGSQSIESVNAEIKPGQEEKVSPSTSTLPSKDLETCCAETEGHSMEASKGAKSMITFCSDLKNVSKRSKETQGQSAKALCIDSAKPEKKSQKRRAKVSTKSSAKSNLKVEQEMSNANDITAPKDHGKLKKLKPLSSQTKRSLKKPEVVKTSTKNIEDTKQIKLTLRERIQNRINRLKYSKSSSYKETPEATNLYEKLEKYTKLGFGVASSLTELSKSGEISPTQEITEDGQVKKMALSDKLVEEMVFMQKLKTDHKALKREFTAEKKNLHRNKNTQATKNRKKESKGMKNETNGAKDTATKEWFPSPEPAAVIAVENGSHQSNCSAVKSSEIAAASNPIEEPCMRYLANKVEEIKESDLSEDGNWIDYKNAAVEIELQDENRNNVQTSTPKQGKSLNQCLDELKANSSSMKRTFEGDNDLKITNPDSYSLTKRPRKSAPRRLAAMGRCPDNEECMDSPSPDTSFSDHAFDIDLASSDVDDLLSASDKKGKKIKETNELLYDGRILTEKSLSSNEDNLNIELETSFIALSAEQPVSESVTTILDNTSDKNLPPTRLFTEDTLNEQMEETTWESCWSGCEAKPAVSNDLWAGVPYTNIPQENYTIKISLDREERIKALMAKQTQLLSKINNSVRGNSDR